MVDALAGKRGKMSHVRVYWTLGMIASSVSMCNSRTLPMHDWITSESTTLAVGNTTKISIIPITSSTPGDVAYDLNRTDTTTSTEISDSDKFNLSTKYEEQTFGSKLTTAELNKQAENETVNAYDTDEGYNSSTTHLPVSGEDSESQRTIDVKGHISYSTNAETTTMETTISKDDMTGHESTLSVYLTTLLTKSPMANARGIAEKTHTEHHHGSTFIHYDLYQYNAKKGSDQVFHRRVGHGLLWDLKNDRHYVADALVPIVCGITGAFLIVLLVYAFGRYLRNRKGAMAKLSNVTKADRISLLAGYNHQDVDETAFHFT